ncbi:MAG: M28 family metallopeptidase [Bacteroidota bacterium]
MKKSILLVFTAVIIILGGTAYAVLSETKEQASIKEQYSDIASKIIAASLQDSNAYKRLSIMCDTYGPRISGSQNLEKAIDWILATMKTDGFDTVYSEPVKVPHWVRGNESLTLNSPFEKNISVFSLGGSIATPTKGVTGEVIVVHSFDELAKRSKDANGKIVLFNVPFTKYGETVRYRVNGASEAAKHGAIASLVRSIGPASLNTPHTGGMRYSDDGKKIPHAAISIEDAEMLDRQCGLGLKPNVTLKLESKFLPDANSRNVIAEIRGSEKPEEIVVFGGHIDSWDVGQGAMDDGGGCIAAWEALRVIKKLGIRSKRTLRVCFWTNEENGLMGGKTYAKLHAKEIPNHVLAVESDAGTFKPKGFDFGGSPKGMELAKEICSLLGMIDASACEEGSGGADIGPVMELGVPGMGLLVDDSKYFNYHHTNADMMDKLNPRELALCTASMAVLTYVAADMPKKIQRK